MSTRASESLAARIPHKHIPRNINHVHKAEQGVNTRIAVGLTRIVGSMPTAYAFAALALIGLFAILGWLSPIVALLVAWLSQTFLQLVFLPILAVGQSVLSRHGELQADEAFQTTQKSYHDIEQIMLHLEAQDAELLKQSQMLLELMQSRKVSTDIEAVMAKLPIVAAQNDAIFAQNDKILDLLSEMQKPKTVKRDGKL